jgi:hypothetical protein
MTVNGVPMFVNLLEERLKNTRDYLTDVCDELGQTVPDEGSLSILQCTNCAIWLPKTQFVLTDEIPECTFCADMELLRF